MKISNDNSNINYTNLDLINVSHVIPVKQNKKYVASQLNFGAEDGDPIERIFNAVEINWNGACLGNGIIINSTGELLEYIKNKSSNLNINTYDKETIDNLIGEIEESKVNKENVYDKETIDNLIGELNNKINELTNIINNITQNI